MSDGVYSLAELVVLGSPIPLEPDALPCDVLRCDGPARILLPGCALCAPCWEERLDGDGRYHLSFDDMVGDERWREARSNEYRDRLALMSPRRRDAEQDALLDDLVARRVELLLRFDLR
jgi:hypothetical protein